MHTEQRAVARLRAKGGTQGQEETEEVASPGLRKAVTAGDLYHAPWSRQLSSPTSLGSSSRLRVFSSSPSVGYLVARKDCNDESAPYWTVSRGIVNRFGHACRECKKGIGKNQEAIVRDGRKLRFFYHPECFSGDADPRTQTGSSAHDIRFKAMLSKTTAPPSKGTGKWSVQSYGLRNAVHPVKGGSSQLVRTTSAPLSLQARGGAGSSSRSTVLRKHSVCLAGKQSTHYPLALTNGATRRIPTGTKDEKSRGPATREERTRSSTLESFDNIALQKKGLQRGSAAKGSTHSIASGETLVRQKRPGRTSKNTRK